MAFSIPPTDVQLWLRAQFPRLENELHYITSPEDDGSFRKESFMITKKLVLKLVFVSIVAASVGFAVNWYVFKKNSTDQKKTLGHLQEKIDTWKKETVAYVRAYNETGSTAPGMEEHTKLGNQLITELLQSLERPQLKGTWAR